MFFKFRRKSNSFTEQHELWWASPSWVDPQKTDTQILPFHFQCLVATLRTIPSKTNLSYWFVLISTKLELRIAGQMSNTKLWKIPLDVIACGFKYGGHTELPSKVRCLPPCVSACTRNTNAFSSSSRWGMDAGSRLQRGSTGAPLQSTMTPPPLTKRPQRSIKILYYNQQGPSPAPTLRWGTYHGTVNRLLHGHVEPQPAAESVKPERRLLLASTTTDWGGSERERVVERDRGIMSKLKIPGMQWESPEHGGVLVGGFRRKSSGAKLNEWCKTVHACLCVCHACGCREIVNDFQMSYKPFVF